jgi:flagellar protein FliO/FliZ
VNAVELVGRMLLALGAVLGIMWALARFARRPLTGKSDAVLTVLARQQLTRSTSVAVLKVADRALVLGVSDQGVRMLAETDLAPLESALVAEPKSVRRQNRELVPSVTLPSVTPPSVTPPSVTVPSATVPSATTQLASPPAARNGPLDGSILSPKTWTQLVNVARDVTVRR